MDAIHFPAPTHSPPHSLNLSFPLYQDIFHSSSSNAGTELHILLLVRPQKWLTTTSGDNLSSQCQAGGRVCNEMSNNNMATSQLSSRCSHSDLGDPLFPRCHGNTDAMGSFLKLTGANELKTCKQGFGRKVNERKTSAGLFLAVCSGFQDAFTREEKSFEILKLLFSQEAQRPT